MFLDLACFLRFCSTPVSLDSTDPEANVTRIGEAKKNLSEAIRHEFGGVRGRLEELSAWSSELSKDATGINGLSGFWRSLSQQLDSMAATVSERESGVLSALAGKAKHEMQISVDVDQTERVREARKEGDGEGPHEGYAA